MKSKVSIVKCRDYHPSQVEAAVRKSIALIGGITSFVKPNSKVLIKPNLLAAKVPEAGVTTHPEFVGAVIKILKEINCKVYLGDGPSVWGGEAEKVDLVYELSGMKKIAQDEGIELVKFDRSCWRQNFPLTTWLDDCDCIISLPKFKTHSLMTLTGAVKNVFGCVVGLYKSELHRRYFDIRDFAKVLVDVFEIIRPQLTIVDGIIAMEGEGPGSSGTLRDLGLVFASSDCIALDSLLAKVMGLEPEDILTTKEASLRKLGNSQLSNIEVLGEELSDLAVTPFKLPSTSLSQRLPKPVVNVIKGLIKFFPQVDNKKCTHCQDCVKVCPVGAMSFGNNRIVIDYKNCISCFCCSEACRYAAIKIKKSLLAKVMGL